MTRGFLQAKESWDLSNEDKVELAKKRKEHGNALFKAGKWARAIAKYKSAADTVGYDVSRLLSAWRNLQIKMSATRRCLVAGNTPRSPSHGFQAVAVAHAAHFFPP